MEKISLVVPCYNEEESIEIFYNEIKKLNFIKFEIIFVNDGSSDNTLNIIKKLSKDKIVKFISFSRNFGKEAAMMAGLEYATGDYITIMDVDLQDPPELLEVMYNYIKTEGYDCVATKSTSRNGYGFFRKIFTKMYYNLINKISNTKIEPGARDYRLMTKQMLKSVLSLKEYNRYSKGIFSWVGYNIKWIEFENQNRVAGTSKWNFIKLFSYSLESILAFSTTPLIISSLIGLFFCFVAFILIIFIIVRTLLYGDPVVGWPSLACILFATSGLHLFSIGIIGQYVAKMYLEIKRRPIYIIKDSNINLE